MEKLSFVFLVVLACAAYSSSNQTQAAVVNLGDDFFVIPLNKCPLEPTNCAANPICDQAEVEDSGKARVIISADMAGINSIASQDPDDIQSFVHMLTFADRVDIEGILSGPRRSLNSSNNANSRARFIDIINAYESDRTKLVSNFGTGFPTAQALRDTVKNGSRFHHAINSSNSEANNEAVQQIIKQARCGWHNGDKRPLYLNSWGGSTDIAQAIFNAPDIIPVVRLVTYSQFNNGDFRSTLSCTSAFGRPCDAWNFLRTKTDLWWVDYTGGTLPVVECDPSTIATLKSRGQLGNKIVDSLEPPNNETCRDPSSPFFNSNTQDWFKLGDTWMLMYAHNPAALRDNPTSNSSAKYGRYYQPDPSRPYWQLFDEDLKNKPLIYQDWVIRANAL